METTFDYSFPSLWDSERDAIEVRINAASESEEAEIDDYCELMEDAEIPDKVKHAVRELVDYALSWNSPSGSHLEYNDGAAGRASGYPACLLPKFRRKHLLDVGLAAKISDLRLRGQKGIRAGGAYRDLILHLVGSLKNDVRALIGDERGL